MPVQKIGDVIARSGNLKALADRAQRLSDLQRLYCAAIPPALGAASRVANLRSDTLLLIAADNAAVAAKLRQLAPRLLLQLQEQGIEVTGIRVEVQVKRHEIQTGNQVTKRSLPSDAIKDFSSLSEALPASPLKSAVARLVARRGGRKSG